MTREEFVQRGLLELIRNNPQLTSGKNVSEEMIAAMGSDSWYRNAIDFLNDMYVRIGREPG